MTTDGSNQQPVAQENVTIAAAQPALSEHDTLKYHLLGPSLTKAGQDSVDQQKVSEVIYNASKGSKYFNNEEYKDKNLTQKIEKILAKKRQLERVDLTIDLRRADEYIAELELSRDLSQTVVHIDCDAFYAAVEELDRPELRHVPMAVGKGVLTTCNYHARKFGCRSGMAGFVAMKLCPNLICLPLNFAKYTAKAQEVREILADYDPRFESASIDEAYLNITEYCEERDMDPDEAVTQLRNEVCEKTHITISAGIAPNAKIAKIASNRNKPNGQFRVANDRATILAFMRDLPTRKVNGVGRVFERELDAIGVKTCGDIYPQRAYLSKLFGEKAFQFLMQCYLGLGRTKVHPAEEYERKSVGTESTFHDMSDKTELREKLRWTAEELEKDLIRTQFKGRTLVLKIKLHTYEVFTRQTIPPKAVSTADDLYTYSLPMLTKLGKEIPGMKLRLMGLRCTHLVSTKKTGIDFFGMRQMSADGEAGPLSTKVDENGEWEVWPEEEFEEAARQERQDEMNELERLSQEQQLREDMAVLDPLTQKQQLDESNRRHKHGREILPNPTPKKRTTSNIRELCPSVGFQKPATGYVPPPKEEKPWTCPICARPQSASAKDFNDHIDYCLSRQTIKEAVRDTSPSPPVLERQVSDGGAKENGHNHGHANKRGRPPGKRKGEPVVGERGYKKLFFGLHDR
ncbi:hypothetical protein N7G274_008942 [Stereocaulon virgatum]|uniref:DNA polymerase kappa n=1 Tax=Stereocaulon virgatum TaxID=373712 RepID=A0ABR3ZY33_9LECA